MIRRLCLRVTVLTAALALPSCTDMDTPGAAPPVVAPAPVVTVSITPREATLEVGATLALNAVVSNTTDTRLTFRSSDPGIAGVGETGIVTCVAPGRTTVEARAMADPGMSASAAITCTPASAPVPPTVEGLSISVSPRELSLAYRSPGPGFCQLDVGTFTVLNNGGVTAEIEILPGGPLYTSRYMFPLPPGESRDVAVIYACIGGSATIRVIARAGGQEITRNVRVTITLL